jgi:hypothetical protein
MPTVRALYERWITELWAGQPIATEIVTEDFVGHWPDRDVHGPDGPVSFTGNDILRLNGDGQRFAEHWTGTFAGLSADPRVLKQRIAARRSGRGNCR